MNAKEKYELIEKLVLSNDDELLNQIKTIIEGNSTQLWDKLNPGLKGSIQRGIQQSNAGTGMVHEDVMKEYRSKFKK
jgi:hypothetical protein